MKTHYPGELAECAMCERKPGAARLCPSCLHNRTVIGGLHEVVRLAENKVAELTPAPPAESEIVSPPGARLTQLECRVLGAAIEESWGHGPGPRSEDRRRIFGIMRKLARGAGHVPHRLGGDGSLVVEALRQVADELCERGDDFNLDCGCWYSAAGHVRFRADEVSKSGELAP